MIRLVRVLLVWVDSQAEQFLMEPEMQLQVAQVPPQMAQMDLQRLLVLVLLVSHRL
jgi:hypothetical protein